MLALFSQEYVYIYSQMGNYAGNNGQINTV